MCGNTLFHMDYDKDTIWSTYLDSFPPGMNEVYLVRRHHDCQACKNFICNIGAVVNINEDMTIRTVWDGDFEEYQPVADAMRTYLNSLPVRNQFFTGIGLFGVKQNVRMLESGLTVTFPHFYAKVPKTLVDSGDRLAAKRGEKKTDHDVLKSSLTQISLPALNEVVDLIETGVLYRGQEWLGPVKVFRHIKKKARGMDSVTENRYLWYVAAKESGVITRIKNHAIGTLLLDLTNGMNSDRAMMKYESVMAPSNYKRPKPVFTQDMLDRAKAKLDELGYLQSLSRRFAVEEDVEVKDVLFRNRNVSAKTKDVFDELAGEVKVNAPDKSKMDAYTIETFIEEILPETESVELYLEGAHMRNLCSLIAPADKDSKPMFKWDNPYSWAYTGNSTDSDLKKNVELAGGKIDGALRFSIMWNDRMTVKDDLDAHCLLPDKTRVYFNHKSDYRTGAKLDVDVRWPDPHKPAVENIIFPRKDLMNSGTYVFAVHNFDCRGVNDGFRAEIEYGGQVYKFEYNQHMPQDWFQPVAAVTFDRKTGQFTIKPVLPVACDKVAVWGVKTNTFIPVSLMCYSPNYWGENKVGNKHYMFMLKGCRNDENPYGFYNEFLNQELNANRKVMEALAGKMKCENQDDQLSGVGFSSTIRAEVILKIKRLGKEKLITVKI